MTETEGPQSKSSRRSQRSPNFPSISLKDALDRLGQIWKHEKRHPALPEQMVQAMNFSPKSSGGRQALGALRRYGLLTAAGDGQKLQITDRGIQIIHHDPENPSELLHALQEAALEPRLHQALWERYKGDLPSPGSITSELVVKHKINDAATKGIITRYRATLEFAGLLGEDKVKDKEPLLHNGSEDTPPATMTPASSIGAPRMVTSPHMEAPDIMGALQIPMFQGQAVVVIQCKEPLTFDQWDKMVTALAALREVHAIDGKATIEDDKVALEKLLG